MGAPWLRSMPRSIPRCSASGSRSSSTWRSTAPGSTSCAAAPRPDCALARLSSCSTAARVRASPASMPRRRSRACGGSSTCARFSACRVSAAIGVRNSCAASATKRRSCSRSVLTRSSRRLIDSMKGTSSRGTSRIGSGSRRSSLRASSCAARRDTGSRARRTTHAASSASSGISASSGYSVRSALSAAASERRSVRCATAIAPAGSARTNTRHSCPAARTTCMPGARAGASGSPPAWPRRCTTMRASWSTSAARASSVASGRRPPACTIAATCRSCVSCRRLASR